MEKKQKETKDRLNKIYKIGVIHENYRFFSKICMLFQYLDTGICDSLTGTHGAYRFLEEQLSRKEITTELKYIKNEVKNGFRNVTRNQNTMYNLMVHISEQIDNLNSSINRQTESITSDIAKSNDRLDRISSNSEIIKYCTDQSRKELEYMNKIQYYKDIGIYDEIRRQMPPHF